MKKNYPIMIVVTALVAVSATGYVVADTLMRDSRSYPLSTCPVSNLPLDAMGDPVTETINDREIRFCCAPCIPRYRENIEDYEAQIDAAIIEQQRDAYPTDRCVVMDATLGSMGEAVDHVHGNRLVRFCCVGCVRIFNQDPEPYLKKLDAAVLEQAMSAAPEVCAVADEALGDARVVLILGNQALFLHSEACVEAVREHPAKYLDAPEQ